MLDIYNTLINFNGVYLKIQRVNIICDDPEYGHIYTNIRLYGTRKPRKYISQHKKQYNIINLDLNSYNVH